VFLTGGCIHSCGIPGICSKCFDPCELLDYGVEGQRARYVFELSPSRKPELIEDFGVDGISESEPLGSDSFSSGKRYFRSQAPLTQVHRWLRSKV